MGPKLSAQIEHGKNSVVLRAALCTDRHTIFQDPPTIAEKTINEVSDWVYQGSVGEMHNYKQDDHTVRTGLVLIFRNELRGLAFLNLTSLTKSLFQFQKRMEDRLHQQGCQSHIMEMEAVASTIYATFFRTEKLDDIVSQLDGLVVRYKEAMKKGGAPSVVENVDRIVENYALLHLATLTWIAQCGYKFNLPGTEQEMDPDKEIFQYFCQTCIPEVSKMVVVNQSPVKGRKNDVPSKHCKEHLEEVFASRLASLSWNDIKSSFWFSKNSPKPQIAIAQALWMLPVFTKAFGSSDAADTITLFENNPKDRKLVMNREATQDWYKRKTLNLSVAGILSKKSSFVLYQEDLADAIFSSLTASIGRKVPTVVDAGKDTSIGRLIDRHFYPREECRTMLTRPECVNEINEILKHCEVCQLNGILDDLKARYMSPTVALQRNDVLNRVAQSSTEDSKNTDIKRHARKRRKLLNVDTVPTPLIF